jgi:hypothetical protein
MMRGLLGLKNNMASKHRAEITPAKRGNGKPASSREQGRSKNPQPNPARP